MSRFRVDLRSDTVTTPTPEMRRAMAEAEVGDAWYGDDPTVNRLQEMVAELLGKEAALFLPSGTMCNQVAFSVHCRAGDEIILHETAHPLLYEAGGPAALIGAVFRPLQGERGRFTAAQVREAVRPAVHYMPRSRVVSLEQTANIVGGVCWPPRAERNSDSATTIRVKEVIITRMPGASDSTVSPTRPRSTNFICS